MNLLFRGAACAPLLALLAGCCANNANTCDDLQEDSLFLVLANNRVNADTVKVSFTRAELDTVYLQRFTPAAPARPATNTLPAIAAQPEGAPSAPISIVRNRQTTANSALLRKLRAGNLTAINTLVISNTNPFGPSSAGGKLSAYGYILTVEDRSVKPRTTYRYRLDNIVLQGRYEADGCTTCYENTKKVVQLTGKTTPPPFDATEINVDAKNNVKVPVPLIITKNN